MANQLLFRGSHLFVLGALGLGALSGCSSSTTAAPADTGPQAVAFDPNQYKNNVEISEADACQKIEKAASDAVSRLRCTATTPLCPDYIRQALPRIAGSNDPDPSLICSQWDDGVVNGCVSFIGGLQSCSQLSDRPCELI